MKKKGNKFDLSTKRRKKGNYKVYLYGFACVLLAVGSVYFLRLEAFQISEIQVKGTVNISETKLEDKLNMILEGSYIYIIPRASIFFYPKQEITDYIKSNFPEAQEFRVSANPNGVLEVEILERKPGALWCGGGVCYLMDNTGLVFGRAVELDPTFIQYSGLIAGDPVNQRFGQSGFYSDLLALVGKVQSFGLTPRKVQIEDDSNAVMVLEDGSLIKFISNEVALPGLAENLRLFLADLKEKNGGANPPFQYIDVRYGNKIFYKLK